MRVGLLGVIFLVIPQDQDITPKNVKVYDLPDSKSADVGSLIVEWDVLPAELPLFNKQLKISLLELQSELLLLEESEAAKAEKEKLKSEITRLKGELKNEAINYKISCAINKDGPFIELKTVACSSGIAKGPSSFKRDRKAPFWLSDKDFKRHVSTIKPVDNFKPDLITNFEKIKEVFTELSSKFKVFKIDSEEESEIRGMIDRLKVDEDGIRKKAKEKKDELIKGLEILEKSKKQLFDKLSRNKQAQSDLNKLREIIKRELGSNDAQDMDSVEKRRGTVKEIYSKIKTLGEEAEKIIKNLEETEKKKTEKEQAEKDEREIDAVIQKKKEETENKKTELEKKLNEKRFGRQELLDKLLQVVVTLDESQIERLLNEKLSRAKPEEQDAIKIRQQTHEILKKRGHYKSASQEIVEITSVIKSKEFSSLLLEGYNTKKQETVERLGVIVKRIDILIKRLSEKLDGINDELASHEYNIKVSAVKGVSKQDAPLMVVTAKSNLFDWGKLNSFIYMILFAVIMLWLISVAKRKGLFLRKISGIDAIDEAIGRGVEMGRPMYFLTGRGDVVDIQHPQVAISTMAAIIVLGEVAKKVAKFEARLKVPHTSPMINVICQEVTKEAYVSVGRPDSYREDINFYVTSDQFAYTAAVDGMMIREKPSACFYFGYYYAESLLLAETGAQQGAIQIAATDAEHQLPFFVAACDYALVGEELYAASAYISKDPVSTATLRGQDSGKGFIMILIILFTLLLTIVTLTRADEAILNLMDMIRLF